MSGDYTTNQFYNFGVYEAGVFNNTEAQTVLSQDNPPFIYPSKTLRNPTNGTSKPIQRGYMRMLAEIFDTEKRDLSRRRLHFQFNPDSITRQVTARNDIQLWMNMDPSQITQPIPGDANFAFELLFNREAEVTSGKYAQADGSLAVTNNTKDIIAGKLVSEVPPDALAQYSQRSVTEIGVLADLMVFDEIIGQGLNSQLIDTLVKRSEVGSAYRAAQEAQETQESTSDEEDQSPKVKTEAFDADTTRQALDANWGNSAFLISQPIRIVFSSLFMVEGYVTSTSVTFNKFTPTMVPVQAVVGIQMQAMYVGFARKDTFFTKTFKQNEEEYAKVASERTAEEKALTEASGNIISELLTFGGDDYQMCIRDLVDKSDSTEKAGIKYKYSTTFAQLLEKKTISKVEAFANLKVIYKGNSQPIPFDVTVDVDQTVYEQEVAIDLGKDDPNSDRSMIFSWPVSPNTVDSVTNLVYDKTETSRYQYLLTVSFTVTSTQGAQAEASQTITLDYTDKWDAKFRLAEKASLSVTATGSAESSRSSRRSAKVKAL